MKIINLRGRRKLPANAVRIDRKTNWGNPFKIGLDGDRRDVLMSYTEYLIWLLESHKKGIADLAGLDRKTLACWCAPLACHGNILAEAVKWAVKLQYTYPTLREVTLKRKSLQVGNLKTLKRAIAQNVFEANLRLE